MEIAILMTGTIIPNVYVGHSDWKKRRQEYLTAIKFYCKFAPVFFLENSDYDLLNDLEFIEIPNVKYRKYYLKNKSRTGIGYQEFEMIDQWIKQENNLPDRWIKVTGRYIVKNFSYIYDECCRTDKDLIMDIFFWNQLASTRIFCIKSSYYKNVFFNSFIFVDEPKGWWIERVLYKKIISNDRHNVIFFNMEPIISGISGTVNQKIKERKHIQIRSLNILRKINSLICTSQLFLLTNVKNVLTFYLWKFGLLEKVKKIYHELF